MDWKQRIMDLAFAIHKLDLNGPGLRWARAQETAEELLRQFKAEVERDLIRRGMGEPPVSEGRLGEIRRLNRHETRYLIEEIMPLIDHLQARIAFLSHDNQAWADGYQRGLEDGIKRCQEVVNRNKEPAGSEGILLQRMARCLQEIVQMSPEDGRNEQRQVEASHTPPGSQTPP